MPQNAKTIEFERGVRIDAFFTQNYAELFSRCLEMLPVCRRSLKARREVFDDTRLLLNSMLLRSRVETFGPHVVRVGEVRANR